MKQKPDPIEEFILFEILIISNQKFQEQLEWYLNLNTIKIQSWGNRIAFRAYFEFERIAWIANSIFTEKKKKKTSKASSSPNPITQTTVFQSGKILKTKNI